MARFCPAGGFFFFFFSFLNREGGEGGGDLLLIGEEVLWLGRIRGFETSFPRMSADSDVNSVGARGLCQQVKRAIRENGSRGERGEAWNDDLWSAIGMVRPRCDSV